MRASTISLKAEPRGTFPPLVVTPMRVVRKDSEQCHLRCQAGRSNDTIRITNIWEQRPARTSGFMCRIGVLLIRIYHGVQKNNKADTAKSLPEERNVEVVLMMFSLVYKLYGVFETYRESPIQARPSAKFQ